MSANEAHQNDGSGNNVEGSQADSPDVQDIMRQIRKKIKEDVESHSDRRNTFAPYQADTNADIKLQAGDLLQSPSLLFLNKHCAQSEHTRSDHFQSHRGGIVGKIVTKIKRKFHSLVFLMIDRYLTSEREFQGNLVRHLNETAKYVDSRDTANFWELIRKIDYDVEKCLDRIERINDEQMGSLRTQEKWVNETVQSNVIDIRDKVARHDAEINTLESVARGLESVVARLKQPASEVPVAEESDKLAKEVADYSYLLLENRYRGSESDIQERMQIYPEYFSSSEPVLEIGPGRGELLELFKEKNTNAYGVDMDQAMVEAACSKGLDVRLGDGIAHLRTLADRSLSGVIAIQVVEHLTRPQLEDLFALCLAKVIPGGKVIFETINPRSLLALSSNYFRDPTHIWPLHPDTLEYTMNLAGLKTVDVRFLSEVDRQAQLRKIPVQEYMSPRWGHTIDTINTNFEQLNTLIYGYQDYCIVAETPER